MFSLIFQKITFYFPLYFIILHAHIIKTIAEEEEEGAKRFTEQPAIYNWSWKYSSTAVAALHKLSGCHSSFYSLPKFTNVIISAHLRYSPTRPVQSFPSILVRHHMWLYPKNISQHTKAKLGTAEKSIEFELNVCRLHLIPVHPGSLSHH